jgi:RsmE family RNA methyltransferase
MNLCILDSSEEIQVLQASDRRAVHILGVLGKTRGDSLKAASLDGMLGTARIVSIDPDKVVVHFYAEMPAPLLYPVHVLLGAVRPIQAARIVRDLTALGVASIWFFPTELGEKSYLQASFYRKKEYLAHAQEGAEQAGNPRRPQMLLFWSRKKLLEALRQQDRPAGLRLICHPDAPAGLGSVPLRPEVVRTAEIQASAVPPVYLAIGTERGWTDAELAEFESEGFMRCGLGSRILRTETAAIASVSVLLSRMGAL